jgi:hypothetical protein
MVPPSKQSIMEVRKQVTLFIIYSISARILEIIDVPTQVSDVFVLL